MGGAHAMAGAPAVAGSGSSGAPGMAGSAGSSNGGSAGSSAGSSSAGSSSGGASGTAGASGGAGGSGGASGGSGGAAGGSGGGGGSAGSGDCAGHALSLSANGTGTASDAAKARVDADLMSDLPIGNALRTIEFWAYVKSSDWGPGGADKNTLFFYGGTTRDAPAFGLDFGVPSGANGTIDPFTNAIFDNDNQDSKVPYAQSQWIHFAMAWDGTEVLGYVNGVLVAHKDHGSNAQTMLKTTQSVITIGGYDPAYFAGYIDEFRVWKVTRTADQIKATMSKGLLGNEDGLVAYYKFNESSGTTAADSVTTAGHTAHNAPLKAAMPSQVPTFVVPNPPTPITCP